MSGDEEEGEGGGGGGREGGGGGEGGIEDSEMVHDATADNDKWHL